MNNNIEKVYSDYLRETFYYIQHKSGLKIVFVPKSFSSYYALLGVKYGSIDNSFRTNTESDIINVPDGIAHYLEHKMFECEDGSDAFALFSKLGADANAFTTNNMTAYLFSCTSNFEQSLTALLNFVRKPYFTDENVEKERGIISEEIEMYEDDPYSALNHGMLNLLYHTHPVRINIAGTVSSVSRITPEHLYRCYNAFYKLDNMILSVSGDTDVDTILSVCDSMLPDCEHSDVIRQSINEPSTVREHRGEVKMRVSNPLFCIGIKDTVLTDNRERAKRSIAMTMLIDTLFGPSSEFFSELYSNGSVNSMSCGYNSMIDHAFSYIIGEGPDPEAIYDAFRTEITKMLKDGIDQSDFNRIKKVSLAGFIKSFDSTESIATDGLYYAMDGITFDDYSSLLFEIDYTYVTDIAQELFDEDKCAMMTVLPQQKEGA